MSRLAYGKMSFSGGEPVLQDKSITSNGTYTADEGYDGIGTATVNVPNPSTGTVSITSNGTTDVTDYASASVNVQPTLQDKTITANGTYTADSGYDGLDEVTVNVPNPSSGTINITNMAETDVTNYATAQVVDADLVASNIKKDVDILGVVGTFEGVEPAKGFIPTAYDSDGYVTSGKVVGMTSIPDYALSNNHTTLTTNKLANVQLPNNITMFGHSAFYGCRNLTAINFPNSLLTVGNSAFNGCEGLASINLPNTLTMLSNNAFLSCKALTQVTIPSGVTYVGGYTFGSCTSLTIVIFRGTPSTIADKAFTNSTNLRDIKVPWAYGEVSGAPWGAANATITYNYTG